jgi:hypothetical protein
VRGASVWVGEADRGEAGGDYRPAGWGIAKGAWANGFWPEWQLLKARH